MRALKPLVVGIQLLIGSVAVAHEVRPGYLELRQRDRGRYDVRWKVPAQGQLHLGIQPRLPDVCRPTGESTRLFFDGAYGEHFTVICAGGLDGRSIAIDGLQAAQTDVLVRIERLDGAQQSARLTPAARSLIVVAVPSRLQIAKTYARLGVEHILSGIDHLLFVLALLVLVPRRRPLLATISAFTVAHSLTLAAAVLGLVRVSPRPVEAVIALSIVFVAAEIVRSKQGQPGPTARRPWRMAFLFGLLHGLGFAGALGEVGLPARAIPVALLFFNFGVELGQLLFIAAVLTAWVLLRRLPLRAPVWAWRVPAYGIGGVAACWLIERVGALGR